MEGTDQQPHRAEGEGGSPDPMNGIDVQPHRGMNEGGSLTAAHQKIYQRFITGDFRRARNLISFFLQAFLFFGPWIRYDGQQAILFDLPARRFHFFWITFWPQDTYFILITLIFLAVLLFASTAVAGRMWCGYACPQTVLTECFVLVERFFEGSRPQRMKLDQQAWSADKMARKTGKYTIWTIMAIWLGITFAAWFQPAPALLASILHGTVGGGTLAFIATISASALVNFGWFREQMCQYACPYARFQSAMFDADTLIIGYDKKRGEPRGKKSAASDGCVDCTMCVQVCPQGIDIRNGLQLDCVACTACLDACNGVMDKLKRPRGLIRYSSLNAMEGRPTRVVRPRVVIYTVILVFLASLFSYLLANRPLLVVDVMRRTIGGAVFSVSADGQVSNLYHLKFINKDRVPHDLQVTLDGFPGASLVMPQNPLPMEADSAVDVDVFVMHPLSGLSSITRFSFNARAGQENQLFQTQSTTFVAPAQGHP